MSRKDFVDQIEKVVKFEDSFGFLLHKTTLELGHRRETLNRSQLHQSDIVLMFLNLLPQGIEF
jgi:hypothetical protein